MRLLRVPRPPRLATRAQERLLSGRRPWQHKVDSTPRRCAGSLVFAASTCFIVRMPERIDMTARTAPWTEIIDFWFPEGRLLEVDAQSHHDLWAWRLHGGADVEIVARFDDITASAAAGELDDWAADPTAGWRSSSYSTSSPARSGAAPPGPSPKIPLRCRWRWKGFQMATTPPRPAMVQDRLQSALGHCEGPDHLERIDCSSICARRSRRKRPLPFGRYTNLW